MRVVVCALLLLGAVFPATPQDEPESVFGGAAAAPGSAENAPVPETPDAATVLFDGLDPMQRVSQLMIVTARGQTAPNMDDFAHMKALPPGGVIIRRASDPAKAASYVSRVRGLETGSGVPVWIGADFFRLSAPERRALSGYVQTPTMLAVAATHDVELAGQMALLVAEHMRAMGFDFYVGPSLALSPAVENLAGTIHCFGADPRFVAEAGARMTGVLRAAGIMPMPMGFPGGATTADARQPAVLLTPAPQLPQQDLLPFIQAIEEGAEIIHVGPALVPTLDSTSPPACISRHVITGLLREHLGFTGIIVAGPIDAPAVTQGMPAEDAAVAALQAGADMLLWDDSGTIIMKAVTRIGRALQEGTLSQATLDASLRRVLDRKVSHRVTPRAPESAEKLRSMAGKGDYKDIVSEVERRSLTLVKNDGALLPLSEKGSMPLLITGTTGTEQLQKRIEKDIKHVSERRITTAHHLGRIQDFEIDRLTRTIRGIRTIVCVLTSGEEVAGQVELVQALKDTGARVAVVFMGYPQNLRLLGRIADAVLLAYGDPSTADFTIEAVGDVLLGKGPISIRAPRGDARVPVGEARVYSAWDLVIAPSGQLPVSVSTDFPTGHAVSYLMEDSLRKAAWDFGDGATSNEFKAIHAFTAPGRYPVTLTVESRQRTTHTRTFYVEAVAPGQ
jgi:beta-N-acetylhexosaminidase